MDAGADGVIIGSKAIEVAEQGGQQALESFASTEFKRGEILSVFPLGSVRLSSRMASSARPLTRPLCLVCDTLPWT